ncbi:putative amidoligase enzyme-domain-containing protein [Xylaria sp. FL1042]|nr:putative amidoligase enzyme-domain-containing protein [Xylaria sp. FL1042]
MGSITKFNAMIEAEDDSTETLTCGVELEFLVASIHRKAQDPDPDITDKLLYKTERNEPELTVEKEVRAMLLRTLQQLEGVPFRNMGSDRNYQPATIYNHWRLGSDVTVMKFYDDYIADSSTGGPYTWTNCELVSPVMDSHNYATKIGDVCRVLNTVRIHLNDSTGLHVHVGRGNEPFSLLTLKKFVTLYWLTEEAIIKLHHPSRWRHLHCPLLTKSSVLVVEALDNAEATRQRFGDNYQMMKDYVPVGKLTKLQHDQLRLLWNCRNIIDVAELMEVSDVADDLTSCGRGTVGFQRFLPNGSSRGNIQTFEWRQMAGSLNANHINQWVEACIKFTDFCRLSDEATFKKFVENVIERGKHYTGIELLEALGVDTHIFKNMKEVWDRDPDFKNDRSGKHLFFPIDEL